MPPAVASQQNMKLTQGENATYTGAKLFPAVCYSVGQPPHMEQRPPPLTSSKTRISNINLQGERVVEIFHTAWLLLSLTTLITTQQVADHFG